MPFDTDRWRSDVRLSMCTEATRGVWADWISAMWDNDRCGMLVGDLNYLARVGRSTPETIQSVINELTDTQTADVTPMDGGKFQVINRKMRRDYERRSGTNARQRTFVANAASVELSPENEAAFERFWSVFPKGRKKSKAVARASFAKAVAKAPAETIVVAAAEYATSEVGMGKFVQMPSSWLNQEAWNDDRTAWQDRDRNRDYATVSATQFHELFKAGKFDGTPTRNKTKPNHVYGTLRDGRKVECTDYPLPATTTT